MDLREDGRRSGASHCGWTMPVHLPVPALERFAKDRLFFVILIVWSSWLRTCEGADWRFIKNEFIRIGIDLGAGGSVGWLSEADSERNLLNTYDHGRYLQQSYYGDSDGSDWNGKPWRFNPVQGGSWRNVPAEIVESSIRDEAIYLKTKPRNWAGGELLDEVEFVETITLDKALARIRFSMHYRGAKAHASRHQELPAVFVEPDFETLVYCKRGVEAWTNAEPTRVKLGFPNERIQFSEPWAAWVDSDDYGLGMFFPHAVEATGYRVTDTGIGNCSYLAPIKAFSLSPDTTFEYEIFLTIGKVEQIRSRFQELARSIPNAN